MKQRFLASILAAAMLLMLLPGAALAAVGDTFSADCGGVDVLFKITAEPSGGNGTVQVGDGTDLAIPLSTSGSLTIPATVSSDGEVYDVTQIGMFAFSGCEDLSSITATSVTRIEQFAIPACRALTTVSFPAATFLGEHAFNDCRALTVASFPAAKSVGKGAFGLCESLTTASFPAATSIGEDAFNGCTALASLSLPATPPTVAEANAFDNCSDPRYLTLVSSDGVALTGDALDAALAAYKADTSGYDVVTETWYGWTLLTEAPTPDFEVNGIKYKVLTNPVDTTPGTVEVIANSYTEDSYTIPTSVTNPDGKDYTVTGIGKESFPNCTSLKSITANSVKSIGVFAFGACTALETANFPVATLIDIAAFQGCTALASLSLPGTPPTVTDESAFLLCPTTRSLTLVSSDGAVLTGQAFDHAISAYENDADGYDDATGKWYGWTLPAPASAPTITIQPLTKSVTAGETATFSVVATGDPAPAYQWQEKAPAADWTNIAGATGEIYSTAPATLAMNGYQYRCVVTNSAGSATSEPATLTVDATAPTLSAGAVNRTSDAAATVKFTSNEEGQYYYAIVEKDATDPTISTTGTGTACDTAEQTLSLSLTAGAKDIYIVVKDAAGNVSNALKIAIPAYAPDTFTLTVNLNGGSGGTTGGNYSQGEVISINAGTKVNYSFDGWTSSDGGTFADASSASTAFTMPGNATTITASWTYNGGGGDTPTPTGRTGYSGYSGNTGSTYTGNEYPGSWAGNTLTVQGNCANLTSVMVDNVILTRGVDYTVNCGSTVITFTPAYLASLKNGAHTAHVQFTDGRYMGTFTTPITSAVSAVPDVPATGGPGGRLAQATVILWFLCGACCLVAQTVLRKRRPFN